MKWRYSSSVSLLVFAALFVSANSSPSGKKASLENSEKAEIEKKINPNTGDEGNDDDDLLARSKKSSTTTTFCVEIKPGNEQPAVVVCDPSKTDHQVPIPNKPPQHQEPTTHHPEPNPHYEHPNFPIPSNIPNYLPSEYPRGLIPESSYEPLIFIPQQPQIIQPQYIQPLLPQPQIIMIRDPSCPSNNPLIVSNPYGAGLYSRSSQYGMMEPNNYLGNGLYNGDGGMMRSIPTSGSLGGLVSNGYTSPLDLIYSRRGQNPPSNTVTLTPNGGPVLVNSNQNFDGQYNRPVLIQCNPKVIPLSQDAYAAATSGKANANDQESKTNDGNMQESSTAGRQSQFMYQPGGINEHHGVYQNYESLHHRPLQHTVNQYHQSNSYPYNSNGYYKMMPEFGAGGRAAEETGEAVKTVKEMTMQQGQMTPAVESFAKILPGQKVQAGESQHNSQSIFNGQGNRQGVSGGDGKTLNNQEQQKIEVGKLIEGNQNSQNRFPSSSFVQGQTSFVNGDRMIPKDQGLQKQMGFSQNQNQNQNQQHQIMPNAPRTSGMEQKNSQQSGGGDMSSYSRMLMNRMKSAVGQGNLVQPYMVPSSGLAGEKQTQMKGQN